MAKLPRFKLFSLRDLLVTAGPPVLLVALLLGLAYWYIDPTPPHHVVMATGPHDSGYANFGLRYQAILKRHGIDLELRESEGSIDNLRMLVDDNSDVQIAFVTSGLTDADTVQKQGLVSLGSLFSEPLWVFSHGAHPIKSIAALKGRSINIGPAGSGLPVLARQIFAANHLVTSDVTVNGLVDDEAVASFRAGKLDAVLLSGSANSGVIQELLADPSVVLMEFGQAEAYTRHFPFLNHVVLPRGIVSFDRNIPSHDVNLVASTATLVTTDATHPAILELLVQAAAEVHGGAGWFRRAGEYPNADYQEIPVAPVAERYYKNGVPLLQHYLPFWLANLIERMWIVLVSMVALLLPLSRVLPPLYTWRVRSRVYRWYGQLREVEHHVDDALSEKGESNTEHRHAMLAEQLEKLDGLDLRVNRLVLPLSYADELYVLRQHIQLVRDKIRVRGGVIAQGETQ